MRIVYSADLHGHIDFYRQLLELAVTTDTNVAVIGGDVLPHGTRLATGLDIQRRFVEHELRPLLQSYKTTHPALSLYVIPGNDDWLAAYRTLAALEANGLLIDIHQRAVPLAPRVWLAGSGYIGLTPFAIKDWERRDTPNAAPPSLAQLFRSDRDQIEPIELAELLARPSVADELAQLAQLSDPQQTIYVLHCPPWQTRLDQRTGGRATGSHAIRDFILQHQPPLTLHGHIHESPAVSGAWYDQLGTTIAINPGQAQQGFHAVIFDTEDVLRTIRHTAYGMLHL